MPYVSRNRSASSSSSAAGLKPSMCETRMQSVKPPSSLCTGVPREMPMTSQSAMSRAPLAVWLLIVRRSSCWTLERSSGSSPMSCGAKTLVTTETIDSWVSP